MDWTNRFLYVLGNTVVVAAVYGPVEVKIQNSDIFKATIEVYYGTKSGQTSVRERLRESIIKQTCESALLVSLHPREAFSINIQEMQDSGGVNMVELIRLFIVIIAINVYYCIFSWLLRLWTLAVWR